MKAEELHSCVQSGLRAGSPRVDRGEWPAMMLVQVMKGGSLERASCKSWTNLTTRIAFLSFKMLTGFAVLQEHCHAVVEVRCPAEVSRSLKPPCVPQNKSPIGAPRPSQSPTRFFVLLLLLTLSFSSCCLERLSKSSNTFHMQSRRPTSYG